LSKKKLSYVCEGAKLKCSCGNATSTLKVPGRFVQIEGKGQAIINDSIVNKNIFPFGRCSATKSSCTPAPVPGGWVLREESVLIGVGLGYKDVLLETSILLCRKGGIITIVDSGCAGHTTGAAGLLSNVKNDEKAKKQQNEALKKAEKDREKNRNKAKQADQTKSEEGKPKDKEEEKAVANEDDIRKKIVEAAKSLDGSKYEKGGIEKGGVDCSGSVVYSYRQAGINVDRLNAQSFHNKMTKITRNQLKPGDIITYFSKSKGYVNHVQIYLGTATESKSKKVVKDAILNASPTNGLYIVSLNTYLNLFKTKIDTEYFGKILP
jgi:cell wall-associated NlpC family hydrolase